MWTSTCCATGQHLASDGFVVVVAPVDRHSGRLARPPEVMTHGFVGPDEEAAIIEGVVTLVTDSLGGEGGQRGLDSDPRFAEGRRGGVPARADEPAPAGAAVRRRGLAQEV